MEFSLALLLSFIPAFLCAAFVYWIDRYEQEPKVLLGLVFSWGAVVAAVGALLSQIVFEGAVLVATRSEEVADLAAKVSAPLTEESLKGIAVLLVFLAFRREFDSVIDGMVYAGVVALGFAATENTLYLVDEWEQSGIAGMLGLWSIRVVLGAWDHPAYTAWMGLGLAASRISRAAVVRWLAPVAGWEIAVAAHAIHNGLATAASRAPELGVLMFLVDWIGWLLMSIVLVAAVWRERQMLQVQLADEVTLGVLDPQQYQTAYSLRSRFGATLRARSLGRSRATRRFYRLCGELAHKKHQLAHFGDEGGNGQLIEELRQEMRRLAPQAIT